MKSAARKNIDWYDPTAQINIPRSDPRGVTAEEKRLKDWASHFFIVLTAATTKVLYALTSISATSHNTMKKYREGEIPNTMKTRSSENPMVATILLWRDFWEASALPSKLVRSNDAAMRAPIQSGSIEYSTKATIGVRRVPREQPMEVTRANAPNSFGSRKLALARRTGFGTIIFKDAKTSTAPMKEIKADATRGESVPKFTNKNAPIRGNALSNRALDVDNSLESGRDSSPPEVIPTSPVIKIVRYPYPKPASAMVVMTWEDRKMPASLDRDEGDLWT